MDDDPIVQLAGIRARAKAASPRSPALAAPQLTEDAIAAIFAEKYGSQLRYCHDTNSWFRWNGNIWARESTSLAFDWCRSTCRMVGEGKRIFGKASTASGVERFARADRAFAVTAEIWDKNAFLLGTPPERSTFERVSYGQHNRSTTSRNRPSSPQKTSLNARSGSGFSPRQHAAIPS